MERGRTRAGMDPTFINLGLTFGLVLAAVWFTIITSRLQASLKQIDNGDMMLEEIRESIEIVGQVLNRLPELMPSFHLPQNNPLIALAEKLYENYTGTKVSSASSEPRDDTGRFIDGERTEKE
jgi:hypothetical protein